MIYNGEIKETPTINTSFDIPFNFSQTCIGFKLSVSNPMQI